MTEDSKPDHIKKRPFRAYEGDDPYIFVSYAHKDADRVFPELVRFKNGGYNIWYDQGIAAGMGWRKGIVKNLFGSSLFVVFISKASVESEGVMKEIALANQKGIPIIPIYLEDTKLNEDMEYELVLVQAILKCDMTEKEYNIQWKRAFSEYIIEFEPQSELQNRQDSQIAADEKKDVIQNFKYLDDLIHNGENVISLDSDIRLDDSEQGKYSKGINIDGESIVIDGKNHFIDANNSSIIFNITGKHITIKNIKFKNGNSSIVSENKHESGGGAIFVEDKSVVTMVNCEFINNNSETDGGAIYNKGDSLNLKYCNFENNSSKISGGAIANFNSLLLYKTKFKNNESYNGGAIYNYHDSSLLVKECKIRNNSGSMFAGAIYNYGVLKIEEGTLSNNNSNTGGGAILNYGNAEISGTTFKKNSSSFGGAIFNMAKKLIHYSNSTSESQDEDGSLKCLDCTFASNNAQKFGGVICNLSKSKLSNCILGKNSANEISHLISNGPEGILNNVNDVDLVHFISVLSISGCEFRIRGNFENNAIYNQKNCLMKISDDTKVNKEVPDENHAIFLNRGKLELVNFLE